MRKNHYLGDSRESKSHKEVRFGKRRIGLRLHRCYPRL